MGMSACAFPPPTLARLNRKTGRSVLRSSQRNDGINARGTSSGQPSGTAPDQKQPERRPREHTGVPGGDVEQLLPPRQSRGILTDQRLGDRSWTPPERSRIVLASVARPRSVLAPIVITITVARIATDPTARRVGVALIVAGVVVARVEFHGVAL
jgi:hypothetical protein